MFPAVTVCNQNRVNCENLKKTIISCKDETIDCDVDDIDTLEELNTLSGCIPPDSLTGSNATTSETSSANPTKKAPKDISSEKRNNRKKREEPRGAEMGPGPGPQPPPNEQPFGYGQAPPPAVEEEWIFVQLYMSLDKNLRKMIGHTFSSFIKSCIFRGKDCLNET